MKLSFKSYLIAFCFSLIISSISSQNNNRRTGSLINARTSTIKGVSIKNDATYGNYLADYDGFTLYVNTKEGQSTISCYTTECIKKWPPAVIQTDQKIFIADEVNGDLLTTIKGDDDRNALMFNSWALYYYIDDVNPGDKKGIGLESSYYLISDKGIPLKRDANGRLPRPPSPENNTTSSSSRGSSSSSNDNDNDRDDSSNSARKSLSVSGLASLLIIPDVITIRVSLLASGNSLTEALSNLGSLFSQFNDTIASFSSIQQADIALIDKRINNTGDNSTGIFYIDYVYNIIITNPPILGQILAKLKNIRGSNMNNYAEYEVYFSVSPNNIKKSKTFLYGIALKNAMENAYSVIDPMSMVIDKEKAVKSITIDSSNFKTILPFTTQANPSLLLPSLYKGPNVSVTVKVTVNFNIV